MSPSRDSVLLNAEALLSSGLHAVGFKYINLDDGIVMKGRDANGDLIPDPNMGDFKNLSDTLHGMDLLFGVYTDRGTLTCGGRAGAQGHEKQDALWYAKNGVDYVKEDSCNAPQDHQVAFAQYAAMRDGLDASGRDVFFSLCGWNVWYSPVLHAIGNSARIGPDDTDFNNVLNDIDNMLQVSVNGGPGGWNDPCLLLGVTSKGVEMITEAQSKFQFSAWAVLAAPLILSQSIHNMSAARLAMYTNTEIIAVSQDPMGRQGILLAGGNLAIAPRSLKGHFERRLNGAVPDPRKALTASQLRHLRGPKWHESDDTPLTLQPCLASFAAIQTWEWNVSGVNYVSNPTTSLCANTNDCGSELIGFTCVNSGGTCCGPTCYDVLRFELQPSDSTLRSPSQVGNCATAMPGGAVAMAACVPGLATQKWSLSAQKQLVNSGANQCLTVGTGVDPATAVVGRPLADGSWALGFFNAGNLPSDVTCDAACLVGMGWESTQNFHVRDLWTHEDLPDVAAGANITAPGLAAAGGVALYKITPFFNATLPTQEL
jgi:hypothetical protein